MLIEEFAKALKGTMSNFEVPICSVLRAKLPNHAVEVKDDEVLILHVGTSLEEKSASNKC